MTKTQQATSYTGTTPVYTTQTASTFDQYGRVLTATDADNRTTRTAYTPATGAEPTSVAVTDPMSLVTTTDLRPGPRPAGDGHRPGRLRDHRDRTTRWGG